MSAESNFVRQQGFEGGSEASCGARFPALMFQPRIVGALVVIALVLQLAPMFVALGAILWWCALAPRLNPFDALYNRLVAGPKGRAGLGPAPGPRRFAQGMAGTFMLGIGIALAAGAKPVAWTLEGLLVVALAALNLGKFCLGSYVYWGVRGRLDFANATLPWSRAR